MNWFKWFSRKAAAQPVENTPVEEDKPLIDENGSVIDDPVLTRIVNEAWRTGDMVVWNEGDDLPRR